MRGTNERTDEQICEYEEINDIQEHTSKTFNMGAT